MPSLTVSQQLTSDPVSLPVVAPFHWSKRCSWKLWAAFPVNINAEGGTESYLKQITPIEEK